jgi:hypothetical protein
LTGRGLYFCLCLFVDKKTQGSIVSVYLCSNNHKPFYFYEKILFRFSCFFGRFVARCLFVCSFSSTAGARGPRLGDDPLSNPSVTLTPPGTTLNKASATFTGGDTGSDGILGVGETWTWLVPVTVSANTIYTAVGTGTDDLGNPVTSPNYPNEQASTTVSVLNNPTIATTLSTTTTNTSTAVHDSAILTGATSGAGGTVMYTAYTDNACTLGAQSAGTKTVTGGVVPNSDPLTFATAGTYYWQAVYSGDANNAPATSTCGTEALVVNSFTASMTTAIHQGATDSDTPVVVTSIPAGGTVHDSAALTFGGPTPTGNVDFTYFNTAGNCDSPSVAAGSVAINASGVADPSSAEGPLTAGNYAFQAHWAGDANYPAGATSACEPLTVTQNKPSISTTLSQTSTTTGVAVHDSAALSGVTSTAGGSATYTVYTDNQCSVGAQAAGTVTVTNGIVPDSNPITFNAAGKYYWQIAYSGDVNNSAATSTCGSEVVTIGTFTPSISTTLSTTTTSTSTPVHDGAMLSGASSDAGGTATYSAFSNASCSAGMMSAGVKTVAGGVIPDSDPLTFTTPGTYYWQVVYSGDVKNAAATSTCAREILTVAAPPPPVGACQADWKFVGNGWVNFGPVVYLNQGGRLLSPNNPCPLTLPLQFKPGPTTTLPLPPPVPMITPPTMPNIPNTGLR